MLKNVHYLFLTVGVKGEHSHGAVGCAAPSSRWHDMITRLVWTRQAQGLVGMFICQSGREVLLYLLPLGLLNVVLGWILKVSLHL